MDPQALDFKKVHFASRTQSSYASFTDEDATPALTSNLGELIHAVSMSTEQRYSSGALWLESRAWFPEE